MKMRPTAIPTALLLSLIPFVARAQERPPTFTEEVEVRVMDLDVVVTDKSGRPVTDLTRDDFTVRLGGRPVPLDYFARVDEGTIHAPDLATASPDQVLAEYRRGTEAYVPRHFLMYVDLGHLAPDARKRGLEALRDLVTRMGPNDMGRVLMFDRRSKELTEWTNSKEQLFGALTKIEPVPPALPNSMALRPLPVIEIVCVPAADMPVKAPFSEMIRMWSPSSTVTV